MTIEALGDEIASLAARTSAAFPRGAGTPRDLGMAVDAVLARSADPPGLS